jgi:hypothetical protein
VAERRHAWRCTVPDGLEMATVSINGRQFEGQLIDQSAVGCQLVLPAGVKVSEGDILLLYIHSGWHEGIVKRFEEIGGEATLGIEWGRDLFYDANNASIFQLISARFGQLFGNGKSSPVSVGVLAVVALVPLLIVGYFMLRGGEDIVAAVESADLDVTEVSFDLEQRVAKTDIENRLRETLDSVQTLLRSDLQDKLELDDSQVEEIKGIISGARAQLSELYKDLRPSTLPAWSDASIRERNRLRSKVQKVLTPEQSERWRRLSRGEDLSAT